jgi:hypothetical protein
MAEMDDATLVTMLGDQIGGDQFKYNLTIRQFQILECTSLAKVLPFSAGA